MGQDGGEGMMPALESLWHTWWQLAPIIMGHDSRHSHASRIQSRGLPVSEKAPVVQILGAKNATGCSSSSSSSLGTRCVRGERMKVVLETQARRLGQRLADRVLTLSQCPDLQRRT